MTEIIGVRFKTGGKQYYFDPMGLTVANGQNVIVETGKGLEYGTCVRPNGFVNDQTVVQPLRPVVRLATEKDEKQVKENQRKEKEALGTCQKLIERHGLEMKLVRAEYSFDGSKIIFFFTAEGRVDFRALVKDLAGVFRARIELRQIGVRDEARMLGGLGICGKPFCCAQFLDEFQPVSIKMAKTQNLSLNPTKISGTCGRLMCCLKYEQCAYEDAVKRCPKQESFVECPDGVGNVSSVDLLKERVKVRLEDSTEQPKSYRVSEIRVVRNGKGKRPEDYVAPPKEELEKLRYVPPEAERKSRGLGEERDLSALLDRYLEQQGHRDMEERPRSANRSGRRRRNGKKEGKGAAAGGTIPQEQAKERQNLVGEKAQAKGKTAQPGKEAQKESSASGEKKRRRHRPHHRRGKSSGGSKGEV